MCQPCKSCVLCHQHSAAFIPLGIHFCVLFSCPSTRTIACSYTQCIQLVRLSFYSKSTTIPSSHLCTSMCPALPNHIPISAFRRGTSSHCLALPKDRVSCSICHPYWAIEFTFEAAAGNVSRQLVGHSTRKGIVLEAVSDRELPC